MPGLKGVQGRCRHQLSGQAIPFGDGARKEGHIPYTDGVEDQT